MRDEMIQREYTNHLRDYQNGQWNHGFIAGFCGGFVLAGIIAALFWILG